MELIIKPTGMCNFNCTFCSAANLDIAHPRSGVPEKLKELIRNIKPSSIIITGGEPLMVDPSYYLELYELAQCHMSFTSNMKDFYLNPEKWKDIITHPSMSFITSFNYGETRLWDKNTVYTEDLFIEVFNKYVEVSGGKRLAFIAVIDENNENLVLDHVYLAKRLNTKVKLNCAIGMGRQDHTYPKHKMFQHYIKIIDMGLEEYEMTCSDRHLGICSFNTKFLCDSTIRVAYIDSSGELHYGSCEDKISYGIEIPVETEPVEMKQIRPETCDLINAKCLYCELYPLCNGCSSYRNIAKGIPEHCEEMLKLKDDLIRVGWAI